MGTGMAWLGVVGGFFMLLIGAALIALFVVLWLLPWLIARKRVTLNVGVILVLTLFSFFIPPIWFVALLMAALCETEADRARKDWMHQQHIDALLGIASTRPTPKPPGEDWPTDRQPPTFKKNWGRPD